MEKLEVCHWHKAAFEKQWELWEFIHNQNASWSCCHTFEGFSTDVGFTEIWTTLPILDTCSCRNNKKWYQRQGCLVEQCQLPSFCFKIQSRKLAPHSIILWIARNKRNLYPRDTQRWNIFSITLCCFSARINWNKVYVLYRPFQILITSKYLIQHLYFLSVFCYTMVLLVIVLIPKEEHPSI